LFTGCLFIAEEKLMEGKRADPLFMIGCEGTWGLIYFLILLPIFQHITCTGGEFCTYGYFENTTLAFY